MYTVEIRRNSDGIVRKHVEQFEWDTDASDFMWAEGNYACDCNRALLFARAGGDCDDERGCGDGAFSVRIFAPDGKELYSDGDWDRQHDGRAGHS